MKQSTSFWRSALVDVMVAISGVDSSGNCSGEVSAKFCGNFISFGKAVSTGFPVKFGVLATLSPAPLGLEGPIPSVWPLGHLYPLLPWTSIAAQSNSTVINHSAAVDDVGLSPSSGTGPGLQSNLRPARPCLSRPGGSLCGRATLFFCDVTGAHDRHCLRGGHWRS